MLKSESDQRQHQIICRIWAAIGVQLPDDDEAVQDMLDEWKLSLADLSLSEITQRVEYWKGQDRTCAADEFVAPVDEKPKSQKEMTAKEVVAKAKKLYAESDMTYEEAYDHLELAKRWGPL